MNVEIHIANSSFVGYSQEICDLIYESAQARGTGIAKRSAEYVAEKLRQVKPSSLSTVISLLAFRI